MPLPTRWITDLLTPHGPLTELAVAKAVWQHHEPEILASGDLLYTWQLDLHDAARTMAERGELVIDPDGTWSLPEETRSTRRGWDEEEVTVAVRTYVALLRAEGTGRPAGRAAALAQVATETGRPQTQVDAMMSNISAVVQEHGIQPLSAFRPRSNVPAGVRPVVAAALGA